MRLEPKMDTELHVKKALHESTNTTYATLPITQARRLCTEHRLSTSIAQHNTSRARSKSGGVEGSMHARTPSTRTDR